MNNQPRLTIDKNKNKCWKLKGVYHRTDGPAIETADGYKFWWVNGKCHRVDGPAVIFPSGFKRWFLNNKEYSKEEWFQALTPKQQYNYLWNLNE